MIENQLLEYVQEYLVDARPVHAEGCAIVHAVFNHDVHSPRNCVAVDINFDGHDTPGTIFVPKHHIPHLLHF